MHEFLSHFWIRCPYYTLTKPYNCLILMFSSKICYLFTVCTRSHDPLSGENLSPHLIYPYPDRDFRFRGTLVSNGDVGLDGRKESERTNATGTTHGSIEQIGGQWYVFYHRLTHGSDYSRQMCAEPLRLAPDGSFRQAEMTSCGLNEGNLPGSGLYPAAICCSLSNGKMPHIANRMRTDIPRITHDGEEWFINGREQLVEHKQPPFEFALSMISE